MTRIYAGTEITRTGTFRNSAGTLTDPTTVAFRYRYSGGKWTSVTASQQSTGVYDATFTPAYPGFIYTEWKGTASPKVTIHSTILVEPSPDILPNTTDYC